MLVAVRLVLWCGSGVNSVGFNQSKADKNSKTVLYITPKQRDKKVTAQLIAEFTLAPVKIISTLTTC
jgi:hypothetical protein